MKRIVPMMLGAGAILGTIAAADLSVVAVGSPADLAGLTLEAAVNHPQTNETLAVRGQLVTAGLAERIAAANVRYAWTREWTWSRWSWRWGFVAAVGLLALGAFISQRAALGSGTVGGRRGEMGGTAGFPRTLFSLAQSGFFW